MNVWEWLDATSPFEGNTPGQREQRAAERARVLKAAQTSISTLRVARCRGRIGDELLQRLVKATAGSPWPITVEDCRPNGEYAPDPKASLRELVARIAKRPPKGADPAAIAELQRKVLGSRRKKK